MEMLPNIKRYPQVAVPNIIRMFGAVAFILQLDSASSNSAKLTLKNTSRSIPQDHMNVILSFYWSKENVYLHTCIRLLKDFENKVS